MHEELHQFIIAEIKNRIHDGILWRLRGTFFSNENILREVLSDIDNNVKELDPAWLADKSNCYLPQDYILNSETIEPIKAFTVSDNLNRLAPIIENYAVYTLKKLNEEFINEQKMWTDKTDFDRLFLAVEELKEMGVLFNYFDEIKGGMLQTRVEKLIQEGSDIKGYFHCCDQSLEMNISNSSYLRNRFLSQYFDEYTVYSDCYEGLSFFSRSCKAELEYRGSFVRSAEELTEHHKMATIIAKKMGEYNLSAAVSDDGLSVNIASFDWKLRRGEGVSEEQLAVQKDSIYDYEF